MKVKTLPYRLCGLDYVFIVVPVAKTSSGEEYIDVEPQLIEGAIAVKLLEARVPIRGAEARFLRNVLGLSLKDWGRCFSLSAAGVHKWEKELTKRLVPVNEAAVRAFCAEELGVALTGKWSELVAKSNSPKKLALRISKAA
jgi:DNA-binding transcriptional regulator YiaG